MILDNSKRFIKRLRIIRIKESDGELERKKFAQRLKELRKYDDMTQVKVAAYLKFSSAVVISYYECGAKAMGIEKLILLADYLCFIGISSWKN